MDKELDELLEKLHSFSEKYNHELNRKCSVLAWHDDDLTLKESINFMIEDLESLKAGEW